MKLAEITLRIVRLPDPPRELFLSFHSDSQLRVTANSRRSLGIDAASEPD
jgi:hypothetical protein